MRYITERLPGGNIGLYDLKRGMQQQLCYFNAIDLQLAEDICLMLNNRESFIAECLRPRGEALQRTRWAL